MAGRENGGVSETAAMAASLIKPGVMVEYRDVEGVWRGPTKALSSIRMDHENAWRAACWPIVSIQPGAWEHPINLPADDVRVAK